MVIAVCTPSPSKRSKPAPCGKWTRTMSLFTKYQPGLGHDGVGLYGTLTSGSLLVLLDRVGVEGMTHLDVGAADGKVMLGALAQGCARTFGVEVAGAALTTKFDAMVAKLRSTPGGLITAAQRAELRCDCDIGELHGTTVEDWLREVFEFEAAPLDEMESRSVVVTAVWHGFNVEAKEALLEALAMSTSVKAFVLVGPVKKEYGAVESVLDFFRARGCTPKLAYDDVVSLAGSGEHYHALTFEMPSAPQDRRPVATVLDFDDA